MEEINFPDNPTTGDTYTENSVTYLFNGKEWTTDI